MKLKIEMPFIVSAIPAGKRSRKTMIMKKTFETDVREVDASLMIPYVALELDSVSALSGELWCAPASAKGVLHSMDGKLYIPEKHLTGTYIGMETGLFPVMKSLSGLGSSIGRGVNNRFEDYSPPELAKHLQDHGVRRLNNLRFEEFSEDRCQDVRFGDQEEHRKKQLEDFVVAGNVLYRKVPTQFLSVAVGRSQVDVRLESVNIEELFNPSVRMRDVGYIRFFSLDNHQEAMDFANGVAEEMGYRACKSTISMETLSRDCSVFNEYFANMKLVANRIAVRFDKVFSEKMPSKAIVETPRQVVDDLRYLLEAMETATEDDCEHLALAVDRCLQNEWSGKYFNDMQSEVFLRMINEYESREISSFGILAPKDIRGNHEI